MNIKKKLLLKISELGFHSIGFTVPIINNLDKNNYKIFLDNNNHGQMQWLERHYEKKIDPKKVWKDVKTIIVLGINYSPKKNPIVDNFDKKMANISVYARNKDYHEVIKEKLLLFKSWFSSEFGNEVKFFIDTAPIFEKPLAQKSGIGWQGKNTNIVSKKFGSWLFLSEIFLPIKIEEDKSEVDHCGSCSDCIDICPTQALINDYEIDAKKCISYLTIEHKGPFPQSLRKKIGNKIYGCDDCLSVCPWNKFSVVTNFKEFNPTDKLLNPKLSDFLDFNEKKFKNFFASSPIIRIGWISFIRNVIIACGNSGETKLLKKIQNYLSDINPLIRGTAVWSCSQLANESEKKEIKKKYVSKEKNKYVLYEWTLFSQK